MASDLESVLYIVDQSGLGTRLTHKRMFGEYALYLDTKVVAFVCDNRLYLKPTDAGRALLGTPTEAPPYPGAKSYFLLEEELEDAPRLRRALEVTAAVLPLPKPKTKTARTTATATEAKTKTKAASQAEAKPKAKAKAKVKEKPRTGAKAEGAPREAARATVPAAPRRRAR